MMKRMLAGVMTVILLASSLVFTSCNKEAADLVVYSAVYTADKDGSMQEAFVVKDGKYIYVGTKKEAEKYVGKNTQVLDYSDYFVMPGIVDGHNHTYVAAENQNADFNLSELTTKEQILATLSEYAKYHTDSTFIRGYGWNDSAFGGEIPTAAMLDEIFPDIPVYIKSMDCHSTWVNTKMMELAGILDYLENPVGGVVETDENGTPIGCFRDTAMNLYIDPYLPQFSVEQYKEMLLAFQEENYEIGVTAYNDVIIDQACIDNVCQAYYELDKEQKLKCKVNVAIVCVNDEKTAEQIQHAADLAKIYHGENFKITDIKFFMDGITEAKTASVYEPYEGDDGNYGSDRWAGEESTARLLEAVKLTNDLGLVAHFHAIGDAAATKALDAIEYAKTNSQNKEIRNVITHLQMVRDEDIPRFAKLGVVASFDLGWCGVMTAALGEPSIDFANLGEARVYEMYKYRSILDTGAVCAYATDYPAGSSNDTLWNLEVGLRRMYYGLEASLRNEDEQISMADGLKIMTYNGSYQLQREKEIGSIEVGKDADFIVLDTNLLEGKIGTLSKDIYTLKEEAALGVTPDYDVITTSYVRFLSVFIEGEMVYDGITNPAPENVQLKYR